MILAHMEKQSTIFPHVKTRNESNDRSPFNDSGHLLLFYFATSMDSEIPVQLFISKAPLAAVPPFLFVALHRSPGCRCRLALVLKTKVALNCGL